MNAALFTSTTEEWETPQDFFDVLNDEFHFTLDPCSTDENAKCAKHYTKADDGLSKDWTGETVFCNPPYGREMPKWIAKCAEHGCGGGYSGDADTGTNRHQSVSRIHLRKSGDSVHQRAFEVWRIEEQRTVPVNGGSVQKGGVTMRLIDADALFAVVKGHHDLYNGATNPTDKARRDENLQVMCDITDAPDIDAIPMWWITEKFLDVLNKDKELSKAVWLVRKEWQKEQEAR